MLTTHIETFLGNLDYLKPHFEKHYQEVSRHYYHSIPLDPDYNKYSKLETSGELLFIALRHEGNIVGYFNGLIAPALHYKTCLQLALDLFYVELKYRGNFNGQNGGDLLILKVKEEAKRRGVKLITIGGKVNRSKHMRRLLERNGFEDFEFHMAHWL